MEAANAPVSATCVHPGGIKTNIARASKMHPSVALLGVDLDSAAGDFERKFRVTGPLRHAEIDRELVAPRPPWM